VERILNKRKIRGVDKYLVRWKGFMVEYNLWEKEEDLENTRELVNEFEEGLRAEVRRQEKIDMTGERELKKMELLGRYTAKILYGWDDRKFEAEHLRKLERN